MQTLTSKFSPKISVRESMKPKNVLVLVSKESHCLRDLLYLKELNELPIQIPLVISNHPDLTKLVESHGIKFKLISHRGGQGGQQTLIFLCLSVFIPFFCNLTPALSKRLSQNQRGLSFLSP